LDVALERSVNVGLGPLHNQFDSVDGKVHVITITLDINPYRWQLCLRRNPTRSRSRKMGGKPEIRGFE